VSKADRRKLLANIELKAVRKSFGQFEAIKGVDLEIKKGEFMVFVGPSGCGKSTLLRMIAGLEEITSGDLVFDDERVNNLVPSKRGIAMVFQSYALYPHMTVYENMAFGMQLAKASKQDQDQRVREAAALLQIDHLLDRLPKQMSGGQRQRVAIGRAIVRDPRVFLFDEPVSNLDAALRVATRLEIAKLHHDMCDATMVYVTHDQVEAMTLADRICVLRDGKVEQVGTPNELYEQPNSIFVAGFIGSPKMNFLTGEFAGKFDCETVGIRAEHLDIVAEVEDAWHGKIIHTEDLGADHFLFVDIGLEEPIVIRQSGKNSAVLGREINIRPNVENIHRFGRDDKKLT
jgi:multiple sugar transport system ATP-binding protein